MRGDSEKQNILAVSNDGMNRAETRFNFSFTSACAL
jgi:hypothetical protein